MNRWLRRLAIVAAVAIVLLLAAVLGVRWWGQVRLSRAIAAIEAEVGPLDLSRFLRPELPDDENAAVWLTAGALAVVIPDGSNSVWERGHSVPPDEWTVDLTDEVEQLLASNRPAIDLLARSLPLEESNFGIQYEQGIDADLPPLLEVMRAGRLIRLDARLALIQGNRDRLGRDIALLDRLAVSLARESLLITSQIAMAVDQLLIETASEVIQWPDTDSQLPVDLKIRLEDLDPMELLSRALVAEASLVATTSVGELQAEKFGYPTRLLVRILEPLGLASLLEGHAEMLSLLRQPFAQIRAFYSPSRDLPAWNVYRILVSVLVNGIGKAKAIETSRLLALEALGLRLACLDNGLYPDHVELALAEPYSSGPITVERSSDGGIVIAAPKAVELWTEVYREARAVEAPPFSWVLPACSETG